MRKFRALVIVEFYDAFRNNAEVEESSKALRQSHFGKCEQILVIKLHQNELGDPGHLPETVIGLLGEAAKAFKGFAKQETVRLKKEAKEIALKEKLAQKEAKKNAKKKPEPTESMKGEKEPELSKGKEPVEIEEEPVNPAWGKTDATGVYLLIHASSGEPTCKSTTPDLVAKVIGGIATFLSSKKLPPIGKINLVACTLARIPERGEQSFGQALCAELRLDNVVIAAYEEPVFVGYKGHYQIKQELPKTKVGRKFYFIEDPGQEAAVTPTGKAVFLKDDPSLRSKKKSWQWVKGSVAQL